jgi:transposase-like protein
MHDAIRHNSTLSPAQAQVIAALAAGESITGAARAAGVHRSTIHNWLREGQQFRFEFDTIDRKPWNSSAISSPALRSPLWPPLNL